MKKLLKDYPLDEWIEAADGCEFCKAKYQVRITSIDPDENVGDVAYRITHAKDCPENYELQGGYDPVLVASSDVAGWEYSQKPVTFRGMELYPLKSRLNVGPCLLCEKLVIRVPLILFIDQGRGGQLDFCFSCVEEKGILKEALEKAPKLRYRKEAQEFKG